VKNRFQNSPFNNIIQLLHRYVKDSVAQHALAAVSSGVTAAAVAAPWEPTTIDAVQGITGPAAAVVEVVRSVAAGAGKTLNITGFNFAPSPFLKCVWGDETVLASRTHPQALLPAPANFGVTGGATCADFKLSGGVAAEGPGPAMVVAGARRVAAAAAGSATSAAAVSVDGTSVTCPMPAAGKLGYSRLAVVADRTFTTVPYEFTEEALACGGGGGGAAAGVTAATAANATNATAAAAAAAAAGVALPKALAAAFAASGGVGGGVTLGLWALPTAPTPGVLLRVSGTNPDEAFTIEFDGSRFVVRDNFVGAMTCPGPPVAIGEWVYFVLSLNLTGRVVCSFE
jgi:type IV secretory pathway VirB2 component (pilin)